MKKSLLLVLFSALAAVAMAVPSRKVWRTVTQSDGTELRIALCGDENFHFYMTEDEVPLLLDEATGDYFYATALGFGMASTGVVAHEAALRTPAETAVLSDMEGVSAMRRYSPRGNAAQQRRMRRRAGVRRSISDGQEKRGLVIMVSFSDRDFSTYDARERWNDILNKEGYSENGACGSVHDYFYDQSDGLFNLKFDVVGPVKMDSTCYYYGKNDRYGLDMNVGELVATACLAIADTTDFSRYDWDGDGFVEQVYVLYAGWGEHYSGNNANLIWPHEYYLSGYSEYRYGLTIGDVIIDQYACGCELGGLENSAPALSGLGTFCHEFSHCLGLPDFYTYTGRDMLGDYDLLSSGCYNGGGWCPSNYTAYEKEFCGWRTPEVLSSPVTIKDVMPMSSGGTAYKVVNECESDDIDEYYLLENRQKTGWDTYIPGHGLLIMHVDYDEDVWWNNTVNDDSSHPRMTIIPANNSYLTARAAAFPYPYGERDSLTDKSRPAASVYNENISGIRYMGKPITEIAEAEDGTVSFKFCGGDEASAVNSVESDVWSFIGRPATIYDAAGRRVRSVDALKADEPLPRGLYIIKGEDGRAVKVRY